MGLAAKLDAWVAAGLIDRATAGRIQAHEAETGRPVLLWAVAALGLLALGLGIILVISANWHRISDPVKLATHLLLLGSALAVLWWAEQRPDRVWKGEAALFLAGALLLAGQALHAEVFGLTGPTWHLLVWWLALMSPVVLLAGATWITGVGWALMVLVGLGAMAVDLEREEGRLLAQGLAVAAPALLLGLAFVPAIGRPPFRQALAAVGITGLLAAGSLVHLAWASAMAAPDAKAWAVRLIPAGLMAAVALLVHRRWPGGMPAPLFAAILIGPLLATVLALAWPHPDTWIARLMGVLVYGMMWGWIAWAASKAGWSGLFGVAIAAIAIRIFLVYIELFGSLVTTGLGLIGGGLLLVALAFGWRRVTAERTS